MRLPIESKPGTCMETADVYAAGISGKVARITLGGLLSCLVGLPVPQGTGTGRQKSAEAIVGC